MSDQQYFQNIVDRIEFMAENTHDLTVEEKLLQLQMINDDAVKISDPRLHRELIKLLVLYALDDPNAEIRFQIQYAYSEEDNNEEFEEEEGDE